jgi:deoxyribonuclease IV
MLGATVPTTGGLHNAFTYAEQWECDCIQIYLTSSRTWNSPPLTGEQKKLFAEAWKNSRVKEVISHVPFLVNVASPDADLREKSVKRLRLEIEVALELGVKYLVLHPGSPKDSNRDEAIKRAIDAVNVVLADLDEEAPRVLIETMAGQGTILGSTFEEIKLLLDGIEKPGLSGVCFDTAHVFAAGYDISGQDGYEKVFGMFEDVVGVDRIGVFHINDSKTKLGSHHDRHTYVGEGEVGIPAFKSLLGDARFLNIPKVLELPGRGDSIKDNLRLLRLI